MLKLAGNKISTLPPEIARLGRLEELDVSDNDLSALPTSLASLSGTLRSLAVEGNPLRAIRRAVLDRGTPALLEYLASRAPV